MMRRGFNKARALVSALLLLGAAILAISLASPAPTKMSNDELLKLVNGSTFTFIGTIKEVGNSDVSGIDRKDSVIVQVESVVPGNQQALKKLGDLRGSRVTVAVNPISSIWMQTDISAVFFADPLVYDKYIGVVATAVPIPNSKEDFLTQLQAAVVLKSEIPLRSEIADAKLIVTGEVVAIRALASDKAADLESIHNGWELFSEHRPRWKEAIIKVIQRVDKPAPKPDFVSVVFPAAHDCFFGPSPKFQVKDSGIWLLHRNQLDKEETKVLILKSGEYKGKKNVQSYTALAAADFQDISTLSKIQQIIGNPR